jgi:hypothetical protein
MGEPLALGEAAKEIVAPAFSKLGKSFLSSQEI